VELGVVIGEVARSVPLERALEYVAGYLVVNDCRNVEFNWSTVAVVKGKSCDTSVRSPDAGHDRQDSRSANLAMWLEVNGHRIRTAPQPTWYSASRIS